MKKFLVILLVSVLASTFCFNVCFAIDDFGEALDEELENLNNGATQNPTQSAMQNPVSGGSTQLDNPLGDDATFPVIVNRVVTSVLGLVGVLALLAFVYGGVLWMISRGDTAMIQKGKTMMTWAVFGIVIIFSSYAVLTFIFQAFGFGS